MAPAGKRGKATMPPTSAATTEPTLMPSRVSKADDLGLVLPFVDEDTLECGVTAVSPGSATPRSLVRSTYPFFLHNVYAGLVPPFSDFFYAILSHC
ncbi:hypothetical protein D1007_10659 [Hordeum vulgare]|nr:hypothetical protein D1007_10659 [Hordeum vulgare]